MNLRTRFVILALLWLLTIATALVAVNTHAYLPYITTAAVYEPGPARPINFKTMTVAICEKNSADTVRCHDEIKVVCGNEEYLLPKTVDHVSCGSLKLDVPPITSFEVFDNNWEDPRFS